MKTLSVDDVPNCSASDRLIIELVTDDEVHLEQLAKMISENPGLTATIIGLANSAYFGPPCPIYTISDAIIKVLGMQMVKSIVLSVVLGRSLDVSRCQAFSAEDYWADALCCARYAQMLVSRSELRKMISPDQIYLAGLLASFGQLVLVHHHPSSMNNLLEIYGENLEALLGAESEQFGLSQAEAGVLVGRRWVLPEIVINVMQFGLKREYQGLNWQAVHLIGDVMKMCHLARFGANQTQLSVDIIELLGLAAEDIDPCLLPDMRSELGAIAKHLAKAS